MAKYVRTNYVSNISGENYDERESRADKCIWMQVVTSQRNSQDKKIILR